MPPFQIIFNPTSANELSCMPKELQFRVGDYRVYFELHDLGVVVHRILSRNTLKDFLYRSGLKVAEDKALQENPHFWELIENARHAAKN